MERRRSLPRRLQLTPQNYQSRRLQGCRDTTDQGPGSDRACSDACRLFYGNDKAQHFIWDPDAVLPESILDDAEEEARNMHRRESIRTDSYDEITFEQAIFVLENVLEPTRDGDRERFTRITSAARSGGDRLFPHWSDWASRGHHGKGKNRRQTTERFFYGFNGSSLATLFFMANEEDPGLAGQAPTRDPIQWHRCQHQPLRISCRIRLGRLPG